MQSIICGTVCTCSSLTWQSAGTYAGFDETEPTSHQDGKAKVVAYLKSRYQYRIVSMVGDGVTDMEAAPPAVSSPYLNLIPQLTIY